MPNSKNITFDQLQSALTRVKNSLDKKANTSHGNHVPKTETANNARFLRNDNTWQTITPVNIGAADRSHNHTSLTGVTSLQFAAGSSDSAVMKVTTESANTYLDFEMNDDAGSDMYRWRFSAWDTNGATPYFNLMTLAAKDASSARLTVNGDVTASSFTGNATSATKLQTARAIKIGNTSKNFDGTSNVTWTLSEIGAAASSHGHSYLPLSGGTITGEVTLNNYLSLNAWSGYGSGKAQIWYNGTAKELTIQPTAVTNIRVNNNTVLHAGNYKTYATPANIGAAPSSHGTHVTYATAVPLADGTAAVGTSSKVAREDHVHPIQTTVTGNAGTATKLQTARTLTIGNKGKTFDGSANVTWTLSEIGAAALGHTHNKITSRGKVASETTTTRPAVDGISMSEAYDNGYPTTYGNVITLKGQGDGQILVGWSGSSGGHAPVYVRSKRDVADANWSGWAQFYTSANPQTSVSGNAGTATKLQTGRSFTIGNTSRTFDGSANVAWSLNDIGAAPINHSHNYVPVSSNSSTTIKADSDASSTEEYAQLQAGHNYLRVTSSGGAGTVTQGADKLTFNGNVVYHAGRKPTVSEIGAAAASHGTHVSYATATPLVAGTAAVGTSGKVAREDHVHPAQTSVSGSSGSCTGNAATATKLQTARKLTIGNTGKTFNGTADVAWSLSEIGAASSGHSHTNINFLDKRSENTTPANVSNGVSLHLKSAGTAGLNDGGDYYASLFLKPWNDISGGPYANIAVTGNQNMWVRTATSDSAWNNWKQIAFTSSSITGNAASATRLQNARNIKIGNTTRSFNGTADVTWTLADIGAAKESHGNHVPATQTADNKKFLRNDNTWQTVTPANIGAAPSSHTHTKILTTTSGRPTSANISAVGDRSLSMILCTSNMTTGKPMVEGHILNFEWDTTAGWSSQLLIGSGGNNILQLRGMESGTWGEWHTVYSTNYKPSPADIGAAPASHGTHVTYGGNGSATTVSRSDHTHSYIPLGGSASITGNLEFSNSGTTARGVIGTMGDNDYWRIVGGATASNSGYLEIATADDANEPIYVRQYGSGKFGTLTRTATLLDASGNTSFPGTVTASSFSGNATSATRLQTARSINGTSFNGTGDITTANWGTSRTITIGNTGKSVNGGGNVNWSIDEIGALKASKVGAADANVLKTTGRYIINGTPANVPTTNHGVIDVIWDIGTPYQIFYPDNANTAYKRTWNGTDGVWNGWAQLKFTDTWRGVQNNLTSDATDQSLSAAQGKALKGLIDGKAASSHGHNYLSIKGTNTISSTANDTTAKWGEQGNSVHWYAGVEGILHDQPSSWGYLLNIGQFAEVHQIWMTQASGNLLHRGGNSSGWSGSWRTILDSDNYSTWAAAKNHTHNYAASNHTHNYAGSSSAGGNANAAVKLATPRSINGTNFDGSGNITTANWGTGRTITIGNTGKTVNGSGNVSWSLPEIGALPTAGGTVSGNLNVTGAFSIGGKKITINSSAPSSPAVGDIWIKI